MKYLCISKKSRRWSYIWLVGAYSLDLILIDEVIDMHIQIEKQKSKNFWLGLKYAGNCGFIDEQCLS